MVQEAAPVQAEAPVGASGSPPQSEPVGASDRIAALEASLNQTRSELETRQRQEAEQKRQSQGVVEQQMQQMIQSRPEAERPALMLKYEQWKAGIDREAMGEERKRLESERQEVFLLSRTAYCERLATRDGFDSKELIDRVNRWNVTDPGEVDKIAADLRAIADTKKGAKPPIASRRTDSATGTGASSTTKAEILNAIRDRQAKGERIAYPVTEARREAARLGVEW